MNTFHTNLNNPNIDDESKREYFVTLLQIYANKAIDELSLLATERPILEHMTKSVHIVEESNKLDTSNTPLQPIIITRDVLQKKIYGAGYPSLPVLTVQEFYDQRIGDGQ